MAPRPSPRLNPHLRQRLPAPHAPQWRGGAKPHAPASTMVERWTTVDGVRLLYRAPRSTAEAAEDDDRPVMVHIHGFGLSGHYLLPTAERLAPDFRTYVPDLPGFGRSGRPKPALDIPGLADALVRFLDDRGVERATLLGNSMGCPVICEFGHRHADRLDRAILVSPAGGLHNQPFTRAFGQIARDGLREPATLLPVVVPDYVRFGVPSTLRLFQALTHYPTLDRIITLSRPSLAVVGRRDPLMPSVERMREIISELHGPTVLVSIDTAAHAINFSHPGELAHAVRLFMSDRPIVDDPHSPGHATVREVHKGRPAPPAGQDDGPPGGE